VGIGQIPRRYPQSRGGPEWGHFVPVKTANGVTLDFDTREEFRPGHYAFLVSNTEFDAAFARIRAQGIRYYADRGAPSPARSIICTAVAASIRRPQRSRDGNNHPPPTATGRADLIDCAPRRRAALPIAAHRHRHRRASRVSTVDGLAWFRLGRQLSGAEPGKLDADLLISAPSKQRIFCATARLDD